MYVHCGRFWLDILRFLNNYHQQIVSNVYFMVYTAPSHTAHWPKHTHINSCERYKNAFRMYPKQLWKLRNLSTDKRDCSISSFLWGLAIQRKICLLHIFHYIWPFVDTHLQCSTQKLTHNQPFDLQIEIFHLKMGTGDGCERVVLNVINFLA